MTESWARSTRVVAAAIFVAREIRVTVRREQFWESLAVMARTLSSSIQPLILQGRYGQAFAAAREARKIFTERMPAFAKPYGQMTLRLSEALATIGLCTSGSLGARLSSRLGITTCWMTILRRIM